MADKVEKIPAMADKLEKIPSSDTAGVQAFPIEGPMGDERYRLTVGMTDADRAYRAQWLKDQILAESEPIEVAGYYEARYNPIRRAYMWPLNQLFKPLFNKYGQHNENVMAMRLITGRGLMILMGVLGTVYYFRYSTHNWTSPSGWRVYESRATRLPGDVGFGVSVVKPKNEFADFGFKDSPI